VNNNCGNSVHCGDCSGVDSCGGGGTANVCGCTSDPNSCTNQGVYCGGVTDNCGNYVACGSCNPYDCGCYSCICNYYGTNTCDPDPGCYI
jgi:hypothetical protein